MSRRGSEYIYSGGGWAKNTMQVMIEQAEGGRRKGMQGGTVRGEKKYKGEIEKEGCIEGRKDSKI